MIPYLGDFAEDETVYIYFNTFSSNDPSASVTVTNLVAADIFVYKDGNVADLVTDGATVTIDFDSRTGLHKIEIDTSAHADYAVGSDYMVMINGVTVDAGTLNAAIATFSIENRYNGLDANNRVDVGSWLGTAVTSGTGGPDVNVNAISDSTTAAANAEIVYDTDFATNYNQTDNAWVTNGTSFVGTGWNTGKTGYSLTATTGLGNQTANITGNLSGSIGSNTELGPTEVNAQVDTALADIGLDHLISSALPTNWATDVASGSVFDNIADDGTAAYDRTTDSLQAVRDHVGDGTNLTEAGGTGNHLTAIDVATISAGAIDDTSVGTLAASNFSFVDGNDRVDVGSWLGTAVTSGTGGPDVNVNAISDSTAAAVNLEASALTIVPAVCEGTPSTTVIQTDLAETTDDHYIGRIAIFIDGNAAYQATDITDYTGSTGTITVTALTTAPAVSDNLVII